MLIFELIIFFWLLQFTTLLIMVFIFELSAGISGYVLRDRVSEMLENNLNKTLQLYGNNTEDTRTFDMLQDTVCVNVTVFPLNTSNSDKWK